MTKYFHSFTQKWNAYKLQVLEYHKEKLGQWDSKRKKSCGKGILDDTTPQCLLNTMLYMNGLYFALHGSKEHRILWHKPFQIQLIEEYEERPYLKYTEDLSRNHPGGGKSNQKYFTTMPILRNLIGILYVYTSYTTAAVLPIVLIMPIIYNLHKQHLMLSIDIQTSQLDIANKMPQLREYTMKQVFQDTVPIVH